MVGDHRRGLNQDPVASQVMMYALAAQYDSRIGVDSRDSRFHLRRYTMTSIAKERGPMKTVRGIQFPHGWISVCGARHYCAALDLRDQP
jgi:hypothetical protein